MHLYEIFLVILSLLMEISANLRSCSEKHEKQEVCFRGKEAYDNPFPIVLDTDLHLKEIIEINEDKNSVSLFIDFWTLWTDPGLSLSNNSSM